MGVKLRFFPLDITYKDLEDEAVISMYGRTSEGEQICVQDNFRPYFWVIADLDDVKHIDESVIDAETETKNYLGDEVRAVKLILKTPKDVPKLREKLKERGFTCLEADILFVRRYLIDNEIIPSQGYDIEGEEVPGQNIKTIELKSIKATEASLEKPKIIAFDIETHPAPADLFANPILMFSLYGKDFRKVVTWKRFPTKEPYIEFVNSEQELLVRFKELIEQQAPDIITGYFSDGFDLPYIAKRAKKYKLKLGLGLDNSSIILGKGANMSSRITGIPHIDVYKFVRSILRIDVNDYSLDSVAHHLLGENKQEVDFEKLPEIWENNSKELEKFCQYNLHDSVLAYELCEKMLPNILELVKIVGMPIVDVPRMSLSQLVEWFLIKNAPKFNTLAPNKPSSTEIKDRMARRYKGAFVFEPKPGLYKDIIIFDFRSLYPTIIASHNISPATMNCACCKDTEKVPLENEKIWFCQKQKGFLPTVIEDLIKRRMRIKEMMKKTKSPFLAARQLSLKLLANSFYGYLGFYAARWYSFDSAKSVTAYGRHYIMSVIDKVQKAGFEVMYSDTDSIFLTGKTKEDAIKIVDEINEDLPGLMELEFEGNYPAGIFVGVKGGEYGAKKKYALIDEKDEIIIKGFETVRRNWSPIAKDVQRKVLSIILKEGDADKAFKYVRDVIKEVKEHRIEVDKFAIQTQITKTIDEYEAIGPHVAIAIKMKAKGKDVSPGTIITYVITEGKGKIGDKARLVEECDKNYDSEYYIKNQIVPSVSSIFKVLKYEIDELTDEKKQQKLGDFF